jgi:hypothetical protein
LLFVQEMETEQVYDRNEAAFMGFGLPAQQRTTCLRWRLCAFGERGFGRR